MATLPPFPQGLRTRIAPTPSGLLHPGNGAAFIVTHRLARDNGGELLLRIDDLDAERLRPEYVQDIFDSLAWLKVKWERGPVDAMDFTRNWSQSARVERYNMLLATLAQQGHLYACTCSRKQLGSCECRRADHPMDAPDATWRLRIPIGCRITFNTWPHGPRTVDLSRTMPDPVLRQRAVNGVPGRPAYQLASLSDDVEFGITLVVRGEDLLPSTACQVYLASLLGLEQFGNVLFVHHALLGDEQGGKLSKSQGAGSLKAMRDEEEGPELILGLAHQLLIDL